MRASFLQQNYSNIQNYAKQPCLNQFRLSVQILNNLKALKKHSKKPNESPEWKQDRKLDMFGPYISEQLQIAKQCADAT